MKNFSPKNDCNWSPIATVTTVIVAVAMILVTLILSCSLLKDGGPPIASTCSAAISASCHLPPGLESDEDVALKELRWGETLWGQDSVGHCSFAPAEAWAAGLMCAPRYNKEYL